MTDPKSINPYASPQAEEQPGDAPAWDAWSDGQLVVTPPRSELPMRCWVCNAPATRRRALRKTGWMSLEGIVNISVEWHLCDAHHFRQRLLWVAAAVAVAVLAILGQALAGWMDFGPGIVMLGYLMIGGAFAALSWATRHWAGRQATVAQASPHRVTLKGAGPAFLESLKRHQ